MADTRVVKRFSGGRGEARLSLKRTRHRLPEGKIDEPKGYASPAAQIPIVQ